MTRLRGHLTGLAAALTLALTACGGDPSAKPSTSPSSSPSTSTTSSAPSSTAPSPTGPPAQPKGKYGVTVDILNWDKYATDPVVLAAKQVNEGVQGSINRGRLVPGLLGRAGSEDVRQLMVTAVQTAASNRYHVDRRLVARVAKRKGATATLCFWMPSYDYRKPNGNLYQGPENYWGRYEMTFKKVGGTWKLTKVSGNGRCAGGAPQ
ncbi:hypothetical protein AB3X52_13235 [Nocardioides sp. DS6]|uniref:Lipoprotein n=1 Tax=Nocardioides eburneus TaxID=3231482 RepID=A0ABV3T067_9ACTN